MPSPNKIHNVKNTQKRMLNIKSLVTREMHIKTTERTSLEGTVVKNPPANAGDTCSILGPGRSHMPQSN